MIIFVFRVVLTCRLRNPCGPQPLVIIFVGKSSDDEWVFFFSRKIMAFFCWSFAPVNILRTQSVPVLIPSVADTYSSFRCISTSQNSWTLSIFPLYSLPGTAYHAAYYLCCGSLIAFATDLEAQGHDRQQLWSSNQPTIYCACMYVCMYVCMYEITRNEGTLNDSEQVDDGIFWYPPTSAESRCQWVEKRGRISDE